MHCCVDVRREWTGYWNRRAPLLRDWRGFRSPEGTPLL